MRRLAFALVVASSCAAPKPVPIEIPELPPPPVREAGVEPAPAPIVVDAGEDATAPVVEPVDAGPDPRAGCPSTTYRCHQGNIPGWVGRPAADVLRCQGSDGKKKGNVITYFNYCSMDCDRASTLTFVIANGKVTSASGVIKYTGAFCHVD